MKTFDKFLDKSSLSEFIIICPSGEVPFVNEQIVNKYPEFPWKIYNDSQLLDNGVSAGWAKQQLSKMAISQLVKTEHYLIIDDDTYLTRKFDYNSLFASDGKLRMNKINIDFPFFFLWSNQLLDYDFDLVQKAEYVMGITPEIFHTQTVKDIIKYLVTKYGKNKQWQLKLEKNKFTEYGVYWIWLLKQGTYKDLYTSTSEKLYDHAVTDSTMDLKERVKAAFTDSDSDSGAPDSGAPDSGAPNSGAPNSGAPPFFFSFIQSSLDYPISTIKNEIELHL